MNDLDDLIYRIKLCGLDFNQAQDAVATVATWLNEQYPVMGALTEIWLKENGFQQAHQEIKE